MRLRELGVCVFALSLCMVVVLRFRPTPAPAPPPPAPPHVVEVVNAPAIVVASPPPPPIIVTRTAPLLPALPAEPSDAAVQAAVTRQCSHPDPKRTRATVLALAAEDTAACSPAPYEQSAVSLSLCDQSFLESYTVIACGRCLTYRWYEGSGWALEETHRADLAGSSPCN